MINVFINLLTRNMCLNSASKLMENYQIVGAKENTKWGTQCFPKKDLKMYFYAGCHSKNILLKVVEKKVLILK